MSIYLCYDIRGIQQSIFAVPRLKYIVGGSSLIDEFDRVEMPEIARKSECQLVFAGGGRGTLHCPNEHNANRVSEAIKAGVHGIGLDVRIGKGRDPAQAASNFETHARPIDNLAGEPCAVSGMFPVEATSGGALGSAIHPVVQMRSRAAKADRVGTEMLKMMYEQPDFPGDLKALAEARAESVRFMRNVNPDFDDSPEEQDLARRGQASLGSRNRWALIAMDGNNVGMQHQKARECYKTDPGKHGNWLAEMSKAIDESTRGALAYALARATRDWWVQNAEGSNPSGPVVLPFRPLIAGGDDVLLLAHCSWAMGIVKDICARFAELARKKSVNFGGDGLWLATGGELSISAGLLYLPVTFPLASAISYAESLLGSAKGKSRRTPPGKVAPAAVDWDSITEGAIDTPAGRRSRELRFVDGDDPGTEVILTCRPWLLSEMRSGLEPVKDKLSKVPNSVRHELFAGLRQGCWGRTRMLARMKKNHPGLFADLSYTPGAKPGGGWVLEGRVLRTAYADAILLLEEEHRMKQRTTE